MQVKTQKQVLVLQNKAQKVADKLTEVDIFINKGDQHIKVPPSSVGRETKQDKLVAQTAK
jgi:hypothetical protein